MKSTLKYGHTTCYAASFRIARSKKGWNGKQKPGDGEEHPEANPLRIRSSCYSETPIANQPPVSSHTPMASALHLHQGTRNRVERSARLHYGVVRRQRFELVWCRHEG